jgi:hypothetical protein
VAALVYLAASCAWTSIAVLPRRVNLVAGPQRMFLPCSHAPVRRSRTLRLYDMRPRDVLTVQYACGHLSRFAAGELQRKSRRVFSDRPISDLQYRLCCQHCWHTKGMRIILWDGEPSGPAIPTTPAPIS